MGSAVQIVNELIGTSISFKCTTRFAEIGARKTLNSLQAPVPFSLPRLATGRRMPLTLGDRFKLLAMMVSGKHLSPTDHVDLRKCLTTYGLNVAEDV